MVSQKYYNLIDGFVTFLIPSLLHALLTVSLQKGTPSQLLIYSMEVSIYIYIYIGIFTLTMRVHTIWVIWASGLQESKG